MKHADDELRDTRERLRAAREELDALREELRALRATPLSVCSGHPPDPGQIACATAASPRLDEDRYRAFVTASSDAVYRMSPDWTELWQLDGRNFLTDARGPMWDWLDVYVPRDDQPWVRIAVDEALRRRTAFNLRHRVRRADGSIGWIHSRAAPIVDDSGAVIEWFGTISDITAEHEIDVARRAGELRLRSAIEVARVGTWDWNLLTGEVSWSDEHFRMLGYEVGEVAPSLEAWVERVHPDDRDVTEQAVRAARDVRGEYVREFRSIHPDGSVHWLSARGRFYQDDQSRVVRMIGAMIETTQSRELQQRQEVLVAELQHRTRNLIGVVRSIADKTLRTSESLDAFKARFRDRLDAIARVQGLLSRLNEGNRVPFDELVRTELEAHGVPDGRPGAVSLDGPSGVRLRSTTVQTLALGIHELATNAVKHGALSQPGGCLRIEWRLEPQGEDGRPWLHVDWRESGVDMPPGDPAAARKGQGRELIERALPYQLDARTSYVLGSDGVHCTIALPVSLKNLPERNGDD